MLLFQRRDWATLRRAQIPESQARRWKQPIIDTGRISFNHLAEMTALTPYPLPNLGNVTGLQADLSSAALPPNAAGASTLLRI